ncbi:hypothetical protein BP6252_10025 [Coleophoma cylindrospora]|uniref:Copper-fist domain-containing protein n=1 Tax=Coleophoma cylindrospora TaxID=1849047 RepID=A0A3D8QXH0_9HELO|nr:hypothetical protein BP6252_10025 [Coleophoma cylindrospora]
MPTINGQKVACEPCIRGHRSTKCTHHNERLMVPVRKPGRPLSACPHPANQQCACGSVTAAIPRKQQCGCGTEGSAPLAPDQQNSNSSLIDAPSPTKVAFRVQKPSSRPVSRKPSYDPANFARMDMSSVNILPYEQQLPPNGPLPMPNGYGSVSPPTYGFPAPQYTQVQPGYGYVPMQPAAMHLMGAQVVPNGRAHELANGSYSFTSLDKVMESPLNPPSYQTNGIMELPSAGSCCSSKKNLPAVIAPAKAGSCCGPKPPPERVSNGSSCCAPKLSHSHTSSTASSVSEPAEPQAGGCCSSKPKIALKIEPGTMSDSPQIAHPLSPQEGMPMFSQYVTQPTVFTYPAVYGSFQRPLQPSEWKQSVQTYWQPPPPVDNVSYGAPQMPETLDTVHTCGCGDTCQCIGCAAHPYNEATQQYVRSAWSSMAVEGQSSSNGEAYTNGTSNHTAKKEAAASPTAAHTPSSTSSNNGEDQALSATDFFFVNYPFSSDGCGGDMQSCPCGDDCECLGCTIHRGPNIPCPGDEETCPCGDDCECIGCTIHNGGTV